MAKTATPGRVIAPYNDPLPVKDDPRDAVRWIRAFVPAFQNYRRFVSQFLIDAGANSGTGGGGGSGIPAGATPFSTEFFFPNQNAGMVFIGRVNATQWRLWVDDEAANNDNIETDNPVWRLESGASVVQGDIRFESSFSGPVLHGRYREALYRLWVNDEDTSNPVLMPEVIPQPSVNAGDLQFAGPSWSFVNKGRTYFHRFEFYVDNSDGDLLIDAALRWERFDP